jgi:hypothetical protein
VPKYILAHVPIGSEGPTLGDNWEWRYVGDGLEVIGVALGSRISRIDERSAAEGPIGLQRLLF